LQHEPIYEALAVQDGIHLPSARSRERSGQMRAASIMRTPGLMLPAETTVQQALELLRSSESHTWLVNDRRGVIGIIDLARLQREAAEGSDKLVAQLMDSQVFPHVHNDQGLDLALERMGANHLDMLPVVSRADVHKLEGVITLDDVLSAYGLRPAADRS
jgi:CIC family chloride channel protein